MSHTPVLLEEAVNALATVADGSYLDATYGRGGHARALLARLGPAARLLALDRDAEAVADAQRLAQTDARVSAAHGTLSGLGEAVARQGLAPLSGALMDVGVSSPQLEDAARGFSFMRDGPLDMRMDRGTGVTAAQWLNRADVEELVEAFQRYGEERRAAPIARAVIARRPLESTRDLVAAAAAAAPARDGGQHVATRVFQAVRIRVNDELNELDAGLNAAFAALKPGGRLAVITFHSLEHRMVRRRFRAWRHGEAAVRRAPAKGEPGGRARLIVRGQRPTPAEVAANSRSRSALLQVAEKCA